MDNLKKKILLCSTFLIFLGLYLFLFYDFNKEEKKQALPSNLGSFGKESNETDVVQVQKSVQISSKEFLRNLIARPYLKWITITLSMIALISGVLISAWFAGVFSPIDSELQPAPTPDIPESPTVTPLEPIAKRSFWQGIGGYFEDSFRSFGFFWTGIILLFFFCFLTASFPAMSKGIRNCFTGIVTNQATSNQPVNSLSGIPVVPSNSRLNARNDGWIAVIPISLFSFAVGICMENGLGWDRGYNYLFASLASFVPYFLYILWNIRHCSHHGCFLHVLFYSVVSLFFSLIFVRIGNLFSILLVASIAWCYCVNAVESSGRRGI